MSSFKHTDDSSIVERLSEQRDEIYDYVVDQFRVHMASDDIDNAMALADEFFEWMDPDQMEKEITAFYDEHDLRNLYQLRTND